MIHKKITIGFVIQTYDGPNCKHQEFIAGDQVNYENEQGEPVDVHVAAEKYQTFDMVQPALVRGDTDPDTEPVPDTSSDRVDITITVGGGLVQEVDIPKHLSNIVVVVKDYDTDGELGGVKEDENGTYTKSEWGT